MIRPKNNSHSCVAKVAGFTLFEFAIVLCVIGVLSGALLNRTLYYQEQAERAAVQQTVGTLRSALEMKAAKLYANGGERAIVNLPDENPMEWLLQKPGNYLGEYYRPDVKELPTGNWYFDRGNKKLIYLLNNGKSLAGGEANMLKFKVKLAGLPLHPAKPSGALSTIEGVVLEQEPEETVTKK